MSESAIKLQNVDVAYAKGMRFFSKQKIWALKDITLDIKHGETLGILGKNGSGKSTMLKLLANMITPDRGDVQYYAGRISLLSLQVGFVEYLSGRDNAKLSAMFLGMNTDEIESRLDNLIAFSGVGDAIDEPVSTYSAGMRARLGFSIALHVEADVILVDEVIAVGDAEFKKVTRSALKQKIEDGNTAVIVTHDFSLLESWCDRLVWLEKGRSIMSGEPAEVINNYKRTLGIA
ncbi:MAG: ATP-binding cassette domain-containing protein [Candidatus Thiodiazotropha sp. (ex Monitilora ramsayi)]|nr:ATP-binding cassette domain-containing protein [Candidatus Thiodiazotropha sp. (ex Monitilora ramsayi)]